MNRQRRGGLLAMLGPGILVAATGVGAGDIASAGFAGSQVGYAILWAAVLGAFIKFVINEGLMRYQLATGETLLEGSVNHFGRFVQWFFLAYLLLWSFFVGAALISACGVAAHAIVPGVFDSPVVGKNVWGIVHSIVAVVLILIGGFSRFEKLMTALLGLMFVSVIVTAVMIRPDWGGVLRGLAIPRIPTEQGAPAARWTLALMGGVGGTLTMLCYGYWIREQGREGPEFLKICRIDLGVSYAVTALFGVSMVTIGVGMNLTQAGGTGLILQLADRLGQTLGTWARWVFLLGAWGAMFTSMLGVWQAVPYLFADFWALFTRPSKSGTASPQRAAVDTKSWVYRGYLFALAIVPMIGLQYSFVRMQQFYSMFGALVMPLIALALLILNGRKDLVGRAYRNRVMTVIVLVAILLFFAYATYVTLRTAGKETIIS